MKEVRYRINDKEYYSRMDWKKDRIKPDAVHELLDGMPVFSGELWIFGNGDKYLTDDNGAFVPLKTLDSYKRMIVSFCERHFRGECEKPIGVTGITVLQEG